MILPGEEKIEWKMAKLNLEFVEGQARYFEKDKMVVVNITDFKIKKNIDHGITLISELPEALSYSEAVLIPYAKTYDMLRVYMEPNASKIIDWYDTKSASNTLYYGTIIYLAK